MSIFDNKEYSAIVLKLDLGPVLLFLEMRIDTTGQYAYHSRYSVSPEISGNPVPESTENR